MTSFQSLQMEHSPTSSTSNERLKHSPTSNGVQMGVSCEKLTPHQVAQETYTFQQLRPMWSSLKFVEAIKYAGQWLPYSMHRPNLRVDLTLCLLFFVVVFCCFNLPHLLT